MPPGGKGLTEEKVADALTRAFGVQSAAAEMLGVARNTIAHWVKNSEMCRRAVLDAREIVSDRAEAGLIKAIGQGQPWAIRYYLGTFGRSRGYGPPQVESASPEEIAAAARRLAMEEAKGPTVHALKQLGHERLEQMEAWLDEAQNGPIVEGEVVGEGAP